MRLKDNSLVQKLRKNLNRNLISPKEYEQSLISNMLQNSDIFSNRVIITYVNITYRNKKNKK